MQEQRKRQSRLLHVSYRKIQHCRIDLLLIRALRSPLGRRLTAVTKFLFSWSPFQRQYLIEQAADQTKIAFSIL
jgi:hypothetical protein